LPENGIMGCWFLDEERQGFIGLQKADSITRELEDARVTS
jgi:hypothetical protein